MGSQEPTEFRLTEVNYLGQFSHQNLVNLIGYCLEDEHRLLVYEFMPRGSLENHLFRIAFPKDELSPEPCIYFNSYTSNSPLILISQDSVDQHHHIPSFPHWILLASAGPCHTLLAVLQRHRKKHKGKSE
ncbi:hypothetical protein R6Q59_007101 [Mikania micrantha]